MEGHEGRGAHNSGWDAGEGKKQHGTANITRAFPNRAIHFGTGKDESETIIAWHPLPVSGHEQTYNLHMPHIPPPWGNIWIPSETS